MCTGIICPRRRKKKTRHLRASRWLAKRKLKSHRPTDRLTAKQKQKNGRWISTWRNHVEIVMHIQESHAFALHTRTLHFRISTWNAIICISGKLKSLPNNINSLKWIYLSLQRASTVKLFKCLHLSVHCIVSHFQKSFPTVFHLFCLSVSSSYFWFLFAHWIKRRKLFELYWLHKVLCMPNITKKIQRFTIKLQTVKFKIVKCILMRWKYNKRLSTESRIVQNVCLWQAHWKITAIERAR